MTVTEYNTYAMEEMLEAASLMHADSNTIIENVGKFGGGCAGDDRHTNLTAHPSLSIPAVVAMPCCDPILSIPAVVATHTKAIDTHIDDEDDVDVNVAMGIGCNEDGSTSNAAIEDGWTSTTTILCTTSLVGLYVGLQVGCFSDDHGFFSFIGFFSGFFLGFLIAFTVGSLVGIFVVIMPSQDRWTSMAIAISKLGFSSGLFAGIIMGYIGAAFGTGNVTSAGMVSGFLIGFVAGFLFGLLLGSIGGVFMAISSSLVRSSGYYAFHLIVKHFHKLN
jgi:hypothetical protein